jgi:hypothetical protein
MSNDMVQIDYNETEGTLTLNLPEDVIDKISKVKITVQKSIEVGVATIVRGYITNGKYGGFKKEDGTTERS